MNFSLNFIAFGLIILVFSLNVLGHNEKSLNKPFHILENQISHQTISVRRQRNNNKIFGNKIIVKFTGNKIFSSAILLNKLNQCLANYPTANQDDIFRVLNFCLRDVRKLMWQKGYLQAQAGTPFIEKDKSRMIATVPIEEGRIYRLGDVTFENQRIFSDIQLRYSLILKTGNVANGITIQDWIAGINEDYYANQGYLQSDCDLEMSFQHNPQNDLEGIVNLKVSIEEGPRFTVNKIDFVGNENVRDQFLRNKLLIEENKPFSKQKLNLSIAILNQMNIFEPIDKNKDVFLTTDNEIPIVNIKIRVKEKAQQTKVYSN